MLNIDIETFAVSPVIKWLLAKASKKQVKCHNLSKTILLVVVMISLTCAVCADARGAVNCSLCRPRARARSRLREPVEVQRWASDSVIGDQRSP